MAARRSTGGRQEPTGKLRSRAVQLYKSGRAVETIAKELKVSRSTVYNWISRDRKGGRGALETRARSGRTPIVDDGMIDEIAGFVIDGGPERIGKEKILWSPELIAEEFFIPLGRTVSRWTRNRLLKRMGLASLRRSLGSIAGDTDPQLSWASRQIDDLRSYAKSRGAMLWLIEEVQVPKTSRLNAVWAERHERLNSSASTDGAVFQLFGALSASGIQRFFMLRRRMTSGVFRGFVDRLRLEFGDRPILVVAKAQSALETDATRRFLRLLRGRLLLYLIPELNARLNQGEHVRGWIEELEKKGYGFCDQ